LDAALVEELVEVDDLLLSVGRLVVARVTVERGEGGPLDEDDDAEEDDGEPE
jgi:hypothetical protein